MARKAAGKQQNIAAEEIGISPSNLCKIEKGHGKAPALSAAQLANAARAYNVSADWLLGLSESVLIGGFTRDEVALVVQQVTEEVVRRLGDRRKSRGDNGRTGHGSDGW